MKGRRLPKVLSKKRPAGPMPSIAPGAPSSMPGGIGGMTRLPSLPMPRKGL